MSDYITLKWGSLKSWKVSSEADQELMRQYINLGASMSAISQNDTDEQKNIICKLLENFNGEIWLDWTGEKVTSAKAIEYVRGYGEGATA